MFNKNVLTALEKRNMSFAQLCGKCGVSESEAHAYEHADIYPDPQTLKKMADALNLKVSDIAGDDPLEFDSFGKELRRLRETNSIKRDELAKLIGVKYNCIAKWELGKTSPSGDALGKLTDLFGDDFDALVKKYSVRKPKSSRPTRKVSAETVAYIRRPETEADIEYGKRIGRAIRQARKDLGVTRGFAASTLGISPTTMQRIESGYIPKGNLTVAIKRNFGVDVDALKSGKITGVTAKATEPTPKVSDPVVKIAEPKAKAKFRASWIEYLDMIESDAEYRKAASALLKHIFNDEKLPALTDAPQASIVLKMIEKGA